MKWGEVRWSDVKGTGGKVKWRELAWSEMDNKLEGEVVWNEAGKREGMRSKVARSEVKWFKKNGMQSEVVWSGVKWGEVMWRKREAKWSGVKWREVRSTKWEVKWREVKWSHLWFFLTHFTSFQWGEVSKKKSEKTQSGMKWGGEKGGEVKWSGTKWGEVMQKEREVLTGSRQGPSPGGCGLYRHSRPRRYRGPGRALRGPTPAPPLPSVWQGPPRPP